MDSNKGKLTLTQAPKGGGCSSRGGSGASTMDSVNWRTHLKREDIVNGLTNVWRTRLTLRLIPSSEVEESAKEFEDEAYVKATNSVFL
nr:hypothetical protein CFP56_17284 [Quercus suber]